MVGYGHFGGPRATAHELTSIFVVMESNGLLKPQRLLTGTLFPLQVVFSGDIEIVYSGYIPGAEALSIVQGRVTELRGANPSLIYLLDRKSTIRGK